jgi:hypothetical protein
MAQKKVLTPGKERQAGGVKEKKVPAKATEPVRVARDGTQRGLVRKNPKNKATLLLEGMQEDAEMFFGVKNHHPVRKMNLIGMQAEYGYPAVDENGQPVIDDTGRQVMVPPDPQLALVAYGKVAPYIAAVLKSVELGGEGGGPVRVDLIDKARGLAERLGVELPARVLRLIEDDEEDDNE